MIARQRGSASIEYAVTFVPFFVMVLVVIEVCRFMMTENMLDVILSYSTRQVVNVSDTKDVAKLIEKTLIQQDLPLLDEKKISVRAVYYKSLDSLREQAGSSDHNGQPFAEYTFSYPYKVMFISGWTDSFDRLSGFERTILVAHDRSFAHGS